MTPARTPEELDALVEDLHTLARGDHERLCQGREYHCSCGFDEQAWNAADQAAATITDLRARIAELEAGLDSRGQRG